MQTMNDIIKKRGMKFKSYGNYIVKYGVYFIFLVMFILFSFGNKNFLTVSNILLLFQQSAPLMLGVIGMTFVMMDGGIDISAGSNMYLSSVIPAMLIVYLSERGIVIDTFQIYILIFGVAVLIGVMIGVINGLLISKFNMVPFIVTLIMTSIARGLGMYLTNAELIIINSLGFRLNDKGIFGISILIIIAIIAMLIFHYIMKYTQYGMQLKAQGNNHDGAQRIGINIRRNTFIAYVICGGLCGLGGLLAAGSSGSVPSNFAAGNEFIIIPAAVLGGTSLFGGKGTIFPGAVIGILLVNTIVNGMTMISANPYVYTIVRGGIIFLAVMVDSMNYKGELR
jgi:ribose transport system permease protein